MTRSSGDKRIPDVFAPPRPEAVAAESASSLAVACVRALMDRHGLPKYRQSAWLADAVGVPFFQAHRRMSGASPWTLEDLAKVAALFGETLADVVSTLEPEAPVPGVMTVGTAQLPCRIWLGGAIERQAADSVVAVRTSLGWSAVAASEATEGVVYAIERLEARPAATT